MDLIEFWYNKDLKKFVVYLNKKDGSTTTIFTDRVENIQEEMEQENEG